jgi:NitT/TauT family transport system substrate-binding protein
MPNPFRVAVAALVLAFIGAPAGAQTLEVVRVASPAVDVTGNLFYALDLGYFKQAGLDVQITKLPAGADVVAAVIGSAVEIGSANLVSIAQAHEQGFPILLVAPSGGNSSRSSIDAIVVAKDSPIKTAKDLEGKTAVTSAILNILQVQVSAWMDKNGADWKSVHWINFPPPQEAGVVSQGHADAATITEPFLSNSLAVGDVRLLAYTGAEVSPLVIEGGYFCSADYAKSHADVIAKLAKAVLMAGQWANTHRDDAAAIMQKYSNATTPPPPGAHHAVYPSTFKASDLQPLINAAAKYGALKAPFPAADIVVPALR